MDTYTVIATVQSDGSEPVEMKWYSGHDPLAALVGVGQVINHHTDPGDHPFPVRLISVQVIVTPEDGA